MRVLVESMTGKRVSGSSSAVEATRGGPPPPPSRPKEFTQGEFDELCGFFGIPENYELLLTANKGADHV